MKNLKRLLILGIPAVLLSCFNPMNFDPDSLSLHITGDINVSDADSSVLVISNRSKTVDVKEVSITQPDWVEDSKNKLPHETSFRNRPRSLEKKAVYLNPSEHNYLVEIQYEDFLNANNIKSGSKSISVPLPLPKNLVELTLFRNLDGDIDIDIVEMENGGNGSGGNYNISLDVFVNISDSKDTGTPAPDPLPGEGSIPAVILPENRTKMATFVVVNRTNSQVIDSVHFSMAGSHYTMGRVNVNDRQSIALGQGTWEGSVNYWSDNNLLTVGPKNFIVVPSNDPQSVREHYLYFYLNNRGEYTITQEWPPVPNDVDEEDLLPPDAGAGRGAIKITNNTRALISSVVILNLRHDQYEPLILTYEDHFAPPVPIQFNKTGYVDVVGLLPSGDFLGFPIDAHGDYLIQVQLDAIDGTGVFEAKAYIKDTVVEIVINPDDINISRVKTASAPQNFTAKPGNSQVLLSWTSPASDGGSPITGYEVSSDNGLSWVDAGDNTAYTFTGLTNGIVYTFKVQAVNASGAGEAAITRAIPLDIPAGHHAIIFWGNRGLPEYDIVFVPNNEIIGNPRVLFTRANYGIEGWYESPNAEGAKIDLATRRATASMDLYANWTTANGNNSWLVTFQGNGGTFPRNGNVSVLTARVLHNNQQMSEPYVIRAGHILAGWYVGSPEGERWDFSREVTGNMTLHARWIEFALPEGHYVVIFHGEKDDQLQFHVVSVSKDGDRKISSPPDGIFDRAGWMIDTWHKGSVNGPAWNFESDTVEGNMHLFAEWKTAERASAPLNFAATPGDSQVELSWTTPASDGDSPITRYEVSVQNEAWINVGTEMTYIYENLSDGSKLLNGTSYNFRVRAVTAAGNGEWASLNATPFTKPGLPVGLRANPALDKVILNWSAAASNGSPITEYQVSMNGGSNWVVVSGSTFTHTFEGLSKNTPYTFLVRAKNVAGTGEWASVNAKTLVTDLEMVEVPGGRFQMGLELVSGGGDNIPNVHWVNLSGFRMSRYPITQQQYMDVMGHNPSYFSGLRNPVEGVSWFDVIVFANRLSIMEGLSPAYSINNSTNPDNWGAALTSETDPRLAAWDAVKIVAGSNGYRLPTEAQWEYAAKGGNPLAPGWLGYTYPGSNNADEIGWHFYNSSDSGRPIDQKTHQVGQKKGNFLGLYDMGGNVWEWTWDRWSDYTTDEETDPIGPSSGVYDRVTRGGAYLAATTWLRSVARYRNYLPWNRANVGFRLVLPWYNE
ncbi:MAG: SUMF1/EgtB/PvdO family nonheme iron enzyme [Treponema sp.]|nr:SUMF1/EgtB/PvdO family nonheme iron enzyme [Treponema sp.]